MSENKNILQHIIHGVEIEILNYKSDYVGVKKAKSNGHYFIGDDLYIIYEGGSTGKKAGSDCLIYLRPLSDLTKDEVFWDQLVRDCPFDDNLDYLPEFCDNISGSGLSYKCLSMLLSKHYDVFGLIEKELAIDINTLEK